MLWFKGTQRTDKERKKERRKERKKERRTLKTHKVREVKVIISPPVTAAHPRDGRRPASECAHDSAAS